MPASTLVRAARPVRADAPKAAAGAAAGAAKKGKSMKEKRKEKEGKVSSLRAAVACRSRAERGAQLVVEAKQREQFVLPDEQCLAVSVLESAAAPAGKGASSGGARLSLRTGACGRPAHFAW